MSHPTSVKQDENITVGAVLFACSFLPLVVVLISGSFYLNLLAPIVFSVMAVLVTGIVVLLMNLAQCIVAVCEHRAEKAAAHFMQVVLAALAGLVSVLTLLFIGGAINH